MKFPAWDKELLHDSVFLYDGLVNDFEVIPESDLSCVNSHGKDNYASANYMLVSRALSLLQV